MFLKRKQRLYYFYSYANQHRSFVEKWLVLVLVVWCWMNLVFMTQ